MCVLLAELSFGLRETGLSTHALCFQHLDLTLRQIVIFQRGLYRGFLLMQLGCELLGVLNSTGAGFREGFVSGSLLFCEHERSLR
jgi:hypothetical protein